MDSTHYRALISADSKSQADQILDSLITKKVVAGGLITRGPSRYWWEGKIVEKEYYNISTFIPGKNKEILIAEVRKVSNDDVPIVALSPIEGNQDFLDWIDHSTAK